MGATRGLWLITLLGCHLGRPPGLAGTGAARGYAVGPVEDPSAEAGLTQALREGLGQALAAEEALGSGALVGVTVLAAETAPVAVSAEGQVWRATLALELTVAGPAPRRVVLRGEERYTVQQPLSAAQARAAAFARLAEGLSRDAALWILAAPPPEDR